MDIFSSSAIFFLDLFKYLFLNDWYARRYYATIRRYSITARSATRISTTRLYCTTTRRYSAYKNILGREADQAGYDYWVEQLDSGLENRGELLLGFAESLENKALFSEISCLFWHLLKGSDLSLRVLWWNIEINLAENRDLFKLFLLVKIG